MVLVVVMASAVTNISKHLSEFIASQQLVLCFDLCQIAARLYMPLSLGHFAAARGVAWTHYQIILFNNLRRYNTTAEPPLHQLKKVDFYLICSLLLFKVPRSFTLGHLPYNEGIKLRGALTIWVKEGRIGLIYLIAANQLHHRYYREWNSSTTLLSTIICLAQTRYSPLPVLCNYVVFF